MKYGFGVLRPSVYVTALALLSALLLLIFVGNSEPGLPGWKMSILSLHVMGSPYIVFSYASENAIIRYTGDGLRDWILVLLVGLSIPVSVWAMAREQDTQPDTETFSGAMSAALHDPLYRVLYLFHYGWIPVNVPGCALSSCTLHFAVTKCVMDYIISPSSKKFVIVLIAALLGYGSLLALERRAHLIMAGKSDAEMSVPLAALDHLEGDAVSAPASAKDSSI